MNDLISREALKITIEHFQIINPKLSVYDVLKLIDKAPTGESYNLLLSRFRHLLQSDFIRSFDEYDIIKGDYKRDIKEADVINGYSAGYRDGTLDKMHANADDLARLKAENNRLTAELEKAYELINSIRAERSRQACPFGDDRETCAFYKANGCDFCKLAIK